MTYWSSYCSIKGTFRISWRYSLLYPAFHLGRLRENDRQFLKSLNVWLKGYMWHIFYLFRGSFVWHNPWSFWGLNKRLSVTPSALALIYIFSSSVIDFIFPESYSILCHLKCLTIFKTIKCFGLFINHTLLKYYFKQQEETRQHCQNYDWKSPPWKKIPHWSWVFLHLWHLFKDVSIATRLRRQSKSLPPGYTAQEYKDHVSLCGKYFVDLCIRFLLLL